MERERLYELPLAKYDMVIDTSRTFAKLLLQRIMMSHTNEALEKLYGEFAIGQEFDEFGGKYFVNIAIVDWGIETDVILHRLLLVGCKPVYDTFCSVDLVTKITSASWRIYSLINKCRSC
ncbi:hypothetical protein Plhal304r1_c001g0004731 [Plasmopara halstedii]